MTVFLILTALVNIALGYGLAMYLGHPDWPLRGRTTPAPPVEDPLPEEEEITVVVGPKPTAAVAEPVPNATPPSPGAAGDVPSPGVAKPVAADTSATPAATAGAEPELEEHVLAGIEEFRNQLAQMKAQPESAPSLAEAAAAATV